MHAISVLLRENWRKDFSLWIENMKLAIENKEQDYKRLAFI